MKRFLLTTEVMDAHGHQTWRVDAETIEEAITKFNEGDGEIYFQEVEVTSIGEPVHEGETTLDDFGESK